jgi:hypothetical protein
VHEALSYRVTRRYAMPLLCCFNNANLQILTQKALQKGSDTVQIEVEKGSPDGHEIVFNNQADERADVSAGTLKGPHTNSLRPHTLVA